MSKSPELIIKISGNNKPFKQSLSELEATANSSMDRINKKVAAGFAVAAAAVAAGAALSVKNFVEYEEALIGVQKTTDITGQELNKFKNNIEGLSSKLGQSQASLLEIAETAGQLGVRGSEDLTKFTETIAKLNIASKTLQGEQAANQIARILTITNEGYDNVDRFASVIARLEDTFATSGAAIAEMTLNIVQAGGAFKVSASEAAGLAAAFAQVGINPEIARTVLLQFGVQMERTLRQGGESLEALKAIMGQTEEQLKKTFKDSPTEFFVTFLKGLDSFQKAGGSAAEVLAKFSLQGLRSLPTLTTLASANGEVTKALALQAEEYIKNTKLNEELIKKQAGTKFAMDQARVSMQNASMIMGNALAPAVVTVSNKIVFASKKFAEFLDIFSKIDLIFKVKLNSALGIVDNFLAWMIRNWAQAIMKVTDALNFLPGIQINFDKALKEMAESVARYETSSKSRLKASADFWAASQEEKTAILKGENAIRAHMEEEGAQAVIDTEKGKNEELIAEKVRLNEYLAELEDEEAKKKAEKEEAEKEKEQQKFEEDQELLKERLEAAQVIRDEAAIVEAGAELHALNQKAKNNGLEVKQDIDLAKKKNAIEQTIADQKMELGVEILRAAGVNSKALFLIEKAAAIARSIVATNIAYVEALAHPPGPPTTIPVAQAARLSGMLSTATIVATAVTGISGAAEGGIVQGGSFDRDTQPFMLARDEIIVPSRLNPLSPNFDDTFGGGGGNVGIEVSFDSDYAAKMLTLKQREDRALGVQR